MTLPYITGQHDMNDSTQCNADKNCDHAQSGKSYLFSKQLIGVIINYFFGVDRHQTVNKKFQ